MNADFDMTATTNSEHLAKFFAAGPAPLSQKNKKVQQMARALLVAIEALKLIAWPDAEENPERYLAREALAKIRSEGG